MTSWDDAIARARQRLAADDQRRALLLAKLRELGGATSTELAAAAGMGRDATWLDLRILRRAGKVEHVEREWRAIA